MNLTSGPPGPPAIFSLWLVEMAVIKATLNHNPKSLFEEKRNNGDRRKMITSHWHLNICQLSVLLTGFIWAGPDAASAPNEGIEEAIGPRGVSARADLTT